MAALPGTITSATAGMMPEDRAQGTRTQTGARDQDKPEALEGRGPYNQCPKPQVRFTF